MFKSNVYLIASLALIFVALHSLHCDAEQNEDNTQVANGVTIQGKTEELSPLILTRSEARKGKSFGLLNLIDWIRRLFWREESEITLVGLQNSGKTTFVNYLATGEFANNAAPTIGFQMQRVSVDRVNLKFWDVAGQPRYRKMWLRYCRAVKAIVYMVDAEDQQNIEPAKVELHKILADPELAGTPVLVLGNKSDLPGALNELELIKRLDLQSIKNREIRCLSISSKENINIDLALDWLKLKSLAKLNKPTRG